VRLSSTVFSEIILHQRHDSALLLVNRLHNRQYLSKPFHGSTVIPPQTWSMPSIEARTAYPATMRSYRSPALPTSDAASPPGTFGELLTEWLECHWPHFGPEGRPNQEFDRKPAYSSFNRPTQSQPKPRAHHSLRQENGTSATACPERTPAPLLISHRCNSTPSQTLNAFGAGQTRRER
jgi:hypothetical protein